VLSGRKQHCGECLEDGAHTETAETGEGGGPCAAGACPEAPAMRAGPCWRGRHLGWGQTDGAGFSTKVSFSPSEGPTLSKILLPRAQTSARQRPKWKIGPWKLPVEDVLVETFNYPH